MSGTVLKPLDPKEVREFCAGVAQQIPAEVFEHPELVRKYNRSKRELGRVLRQALLESVEALDLDHQLELWQRVYWEVCGVEPRLADIQLPEDPAGDFGWPIVATPEVSLNRFWNALRQKFPCWCYGGDDLETLLDWERQERSYRNGAYAVRVRDRVEADNELKSRSANWIAEQGLSTITLDERIRLESFYWVLSSGNHLDVENFTFCSGSRCSGGSVPRVSWDVGGLHVNWSLPSYAYVHLRAREVVSVSTEGRDS